MRSREAFSSSSAARLTEPSDSIWREMRETSDCSQLARRHSSGWLASSWASASRSTSRALSCSVVFLGQAGGLLPQLQFGDAGAARLQQAFLRQAILVGPAQQGRQIVHFLARARQRVLALGAQFQRVLQAGLRGRGVQLGQVGLELFEFDIGALALIGGQLAVRCRSVMRTWMPRSANSASCAARSSSRSRARAASAWAARVSPSISASAKRD